MLPGSSVLDNLAAAGIAEGDPSRLITSSALPRASQVGARMEGRSRQPDDRGPGERDGDQRHRDSVAAATSWLGTSDAPTAPSILAGTSGSSAFADRSRVEVLRHAVRPALALV